MVLAGVRPATFVGEDRRLPTGFALETAVAANPVDMEHLLVAGFPIQKDSSLTSLMKLVSRLDVLLEIDLQCRPEAEEDPVLGIHLRQCPSYLELLMEEIVDTFLAVRFAKDLDYHTVAADREATCYCNPHSSETAVRQVVPHCMVPADIADHRTELLVVDSFRLVAGFQTLHSFAACSMLDPPSNHVSPL